MAAGNAVLDVMLEPGFFARVETDGQAAAAAARGPVAQSYPKLFAEVRGAGLLLGIRCVVHGRRCRGASCGRTGC